MGNTVILGGISGQEGHPDCDTAAERELPGNPNNCPQTWARARDLCEEEGGYLGTPTTAAEVNLLQEALAESAPKQRAWIGLNDVAENLVWGAHLGPVGQAPFLTFPNRARNANAPYGDYDIQFHAWRNLQTPKIGATSEKNCAMQVKTNDGMTVDGLKMTARWNTPRCDVLRPYACFAIPDLVDGVPFKDHYIFTILPSPSPPSA